VETRWTSVAFTDFWCSKYCFVNLHPLNWFRSAQSNGLEDTSSRNKTNERFQNKNVNIRLKLDVWRILKNWCRVCITMAAGTSKTLLTELCTGCNDIGSGKPQIELLMGMQWKVEEQKRMNLTKLQKITDTNFCNIAPEISGWLLPIINGRAGKTRWAEAVETFGTLYTEKLVVLLGRVATRIQQPGGKWTELLEICSVWQWMPTLRNKMKIWIIW